MPTRSVDDQRLIKELCTRLAFHAIEHETMLEYHDEETKNFLLEEVNESKGLIKKTGYDIDVLHPVENRSVIEVTFTEESSS